MEGIKFSLFQLICSSSHIIEPIVTFAVVFHLSGCAVHHGLRLPAYCKLITPYSIYRSPYAPPPCACSLLCAPVCRGLCMFTWYFCRMSNFEEQLMEALGSTAEPINSAQDQVRSPISKLLNVTIPFNIYNLYIFI